MNEINDQPDRPEHEAERFPGAVRCVTLLWRARRLRLDELHHSAGKHLSGGAWATSITPTIRIAATARDCRLNPDGSCTFTGVIAPFGSSDDRDQPLLRGCWVRGSARVARCTPTSTPNLAAPTTGSIASIPSRSSTSRETSPMPRGPGSCWAEICYSSTPPTAPATSTYNQHNYSTMRQRHDHPNKHWGLDLAYNFDAIQQNIYLCFEGDCDSAGTSTCAEDPTLCRLTASIRRTPSTDTSP